MVTCSALNAQGIEEIWQMVLEHRALMESNGFLARRRSGQALEWMRELIAVGLEEAFRRDADVALRLPALQAAVDRGMTTPLAASNELLAIFRSKKS